MGKIKIYSELESATIFFEGSKVRPKELNSVESLNHPTLSNRIIIKSTRLFKKGSSTERRVFFKKLNIDRIQDKDGNDLVGTTYNFDRDQIVNHLNEEFGKTIAISSVGEYKGAYDASTNTPNISLTTPKNGDFYRVNVAGTQNEIDYSLNDEIWYNGNASAWEVHEYQGLKVNDISSSALTQFDIHVDAGFTGAIKSGSSVYPYNDLIVAIGASLPGNSILIKGANTLASKIILPHSLKFYFAKGASVQSSHNDDIFNFEGTDYTQEFLFYQPRMIGAKAYAINIDKAKSVSIEDGEYYHNGWSASEDKTSYLANSTQTSTDLSNYYSDISKVTDGGAVKLTNIPIVELSSNKYFYNNKPLLLENCGIGGNVFYAREQVGYNLQGVTALNCENVTGYNIAYETNASDGLRVIGGINNRFALSVFQNNWGSDVVTDGVANTKFRDNDLTNSNKSHHNSDGTVSNNSPFLIKGAVARPERQFLVEILDTQIHSTGTNTIGNSYKGIEFDSSLSNLAPGQNIINIDDVGFIGFHDQIHAGNVDATNLKITLGDYRNQEFSGSAVVPPSVGYFYELPYSAHITKVVFPDFSLDGSATTVIIKDNATGLIINSYPVNLIHVDVTTMNLMMGDKIQLENMDRDNISINGNLLNLSTDQSTANTLNSMFERTEVGGGDVDPPMPTLTGEPEVLVDGDNYNNSYMGLSLPDGDGNQTLISNQTGDNKGDVWSKIPMDQLGEFTQFQTDSAGGGKRFYVGFSRADQLATLGDGSGNGHEGLQWSLAIYGGYNAPWTFYGDQATYSYGSFFGDKEAFRLHSGILTNKVTWKVGINENDGRFYVYFWSIIDLEWKYVAKTSYSLVDGDYHAVVRFYTQGGGMYGDFTNYRFPETDPVLTWNYIESPDGVFNYPLFATAEEANFADTQEGGAGESHTHVFPDDTSNTTWYMPDSLMYHNESSAPSGNALGSFTDIIWNEIATDVDSNYAPTPFSPQTIYVDEGDIINLQVAPADASFKTNIGGIPAFTLTNPNGVGLNYLQGTAPDVLGDNVSNPSDTTTVTVYRTNDYGTSQGTLTIVIANLTTPVNPPSGFTLEYGDLIDANTLGSDSVVSFDNGLEVGKRYVVTQSWVETNVLSQIDNALDKVYFGVPKSNANWNDVDLHLDFDAVLRWEYLNFYSHKSSASTGDSTNANHTTIASMSNAYYTYAIEWDGTDLHVLRSISETDINTKSVAELISAGSNVYTYANYTAQSGTLPLVFATKSGGSMIITTTGMNIIDAPQPPVTNQTSWNKALDFSGSNEHVKLVSSHNLNSALRMQGISATAGAPVTASNTSNDPNARAWATAIVFKIDGNNSNQHIWNSGEGANTNDDNIYLRLSASKDLYFGWGRGGNVNECRIAANLNTSHWYGIYIASTGERLSTSNATGANLADCFDIRLMTSEYSFPSVGSNLSTPDNWGVHGSTGVRMDRAVSGDFTIGGRGSNRNFHGKVASMVVTTLKNNQVMPTSAEIKAMITDPIGWVTDYKLGSTFMSTGQTGGGSMQFPYSVPTTNYAAIRSTQVWLMGDGTSDSYANGIRSYIYPSDQNNVKLQLNSMVSNDFETVNINGLS